MGGNGGGGEYSGGGGVYSNSTWTGIPVLLNTAEHG